MTLKASLIGAIASAFLVTGPACAQVVPTDDEAAAAVGQQEASTVEAPSGFRLLEHGAWQRARDFSPDAALDSAGGRVHLPRHYPQAGRDGPSGFRRATYLPHVQAAEARYALPTGLLDALVWTESRYNPVAVSKAGAAGLGQLMPGTARDLGVANRFDALTNIDGAARYLRRMLDKFGVVHLALAAYNAGPGAVESARGIPRNGETPSYVRNVLRYWQPATGG